MKSKSQGNWTTLFRSHTVGQTPQESKAMVSGSGNDTSRDEGRGCDQGGCTGGMQVLFLDLGGSFTGVHIITIY